MKAVRIAILVLVIAIGGALLISEKNANEKLRAENQRLLQGIEQLTNKPAPPAEPQVSEAELQQLRKDAGEVYRLRAQVAALSKAQTLPPKSSTVIPTISAPPDLDEETARNPMKRHQLGQKLAREGKFAEALEHYLWCYDEGTKFDPSFVGVRSSFLLNNIKDLGEKFPAAKEALVTRRDAVEKSIASSQTANLLSVMDYTRLNASLNDPGRSVTLFDQLPDKHPARAKLVELAGDQFVKANRYQDIVNAGNPEAAFDLAAMSANASKLVVKDESVDAMMRRHAVEAGGQGLEALAGAGQTDRAITFADKILKFDSSAETKAELLKVAERLNNPQLIEHLRAK